MTEERVQLLRICLMLPALLAGSATLAADADNGKRLAEMRCMTCHIVSPDQRRELSNAPPFDVIARKFASSPDMLAFAILDPHPRMSVTLTRPEAQDIAAYINTLVR
jgi:mono/diheme cytochrome c family protein